MTSRSGERCNDAIKMDAYRLGSDLSLSPNVEGAASVEAPAVFAGYAVVVPGLGIDELKGLDLHGKIVVIFGSEADTGWASHAARVALVPSIVDQLADLALNPLQGAHLNATIPIASAIVLFSGSPHTLEASQALAKDGQPLPKFPLAVNVRASRTHIGRGESPNPNRSTLPALRTR
jgi:hypothetical protein